MKRYLSARALLAAALLALACFTISASGAGAAARIGTKTVNAAPRLPHGAKALGAVSTSKTVSGVVVLRPRDEGVLTRFIAQVTDKKSSLFHHYLTPGAFAQKFGPTPASIAAVKSQLQHDGLSVRVARDGMILHFSATAGKVETAFHTGLERVRLADGSIGQARTGAIRLPSTIAGKVAAVVGLDNLVRYRSSTLLHAPRSAQGTHPAAKTSSFIHPAGSPTPCSAAQQAARAFGGLTDDQIGNAYGAFGLYGQSDFGAGQHVGIYELEPFATSDIQTFDTCYFGATEAADMISRLNTISVDGGQPSGPGGGEATLDIQDVSAFAPGSNIDVYEASNNTFGAFDEYVQMVNDDTDQIISSSWGLCEQAVQEGEPGVQQAENLVFEQAAAQGQSVFSAAGDEGDDTCDAFRTGAPVDPVLSVNDPSSQPYVVAVGGTTIDDATQDPQEHVWNDGAIFGAGGGGISESWAAPTWQLSSLVPGGVSDPGNQATVSAAESFMGTGFCLSDTSGGGFEDACRQLPDVSAQADEFTGAVTIYAGELGFGWITIGGTSSAAPIWAALLADINESSTCQNNGLGSAGVGFVSPLLYGVASNPTAYAASFNDITTGNNDIYGVSPSGGPALFGATTGYDMGSGLGSPELTQPGDQAGLAAYLCNEAPSVTRPTITGLSPGFGPTNNSTAVTITGTNFEDGGGNPQVASVAVGGFVIPSFTVMSATTIDATFPSSASFETPPGDQTDGAGRYQVTVTLNDGETTAPSANSWFTFVDENGSSQPVPSVTSVHAYGGPEAGGNTVQIFGAGFTGVTGASGVTFGGVDATSYTVDSDWKITATVPAYGGGTTCDQDGSSFGTGENATNDICQAQVVVTNANGSSATSTILPLYEGAFAFNAHGAIPAPPGEEAAPAATEYDYFPEPTITSVSTDNGPGSLASEYGFSLITIQGTGFNLAGLSSISFGDPTLEFSNATFALVSITGTEIQIFAPPIDVTTDTTQVPVNIQTLGDLTASDQGNATYAGVPSVDSVVATAGPTAGLPGGPDTGGTPIDMTGAGFQDQSLVVLFNDAATGSGFSFGTQYNFNVTDDNDLSTNTVAQNPAVVDTQVCTVTDCSFPTSVTGDPSDEFFLFPPGAPKVDSIAPASGLSTGGTHVTITGENLGCVTGVFFGSTPAVTFSNQQALLDCGSTNTVTVTAPPGSAGSTVPVTVTTVESDFTGDTPTTSASFTYTAPPPQTLTVSKAGAGIGTVTSSPAGIDCGSTCSHAFVFGTSVTLTATPDSSSTFAGWAGGGCSGTGTCTVTMDSTTSVTATFTANPPPPPKACVVPKLKGKTLKAAKRSLKSHHCSLGKVRHAFSKKVKKGRVISQKPRAGKRLKPGAKVGVTLSKGKKH